MPIALEVIATSVDDALAAEQGGAARVELVRSLDRGGLTPPLALVDAVLAHVRDAGARDGPRDRAARGAEPGSARRVSSTRRAHRAAPRGWAGVRRAGGRTHRRGAARRRRRRGGPCPSRFIARSKTWSIPWPPWRRLGTSSGGRPRALRRGSRRPGPRGRNGWARWSGRAAAGLTDARWRRNHRRGPESLVAGAGADARCTSAGWCASRPRSTAASRPRASPPSSPACAISGPEPATSFL